MSIHHRHTHRHLDVLVVRAIVRWTLGIGIAAGLVAAFIVAVR